MSKTIRPIKKYFKLSTKSWIIFSAFMMLGFLICLLLQKITTSDVHVPLIFILVVLLISLNTEGYFYGFLASLLSVFAVNWAFTYPYFKLDFSIYGYPLTFITMLAVGIAASTLGAISIEREKIKAESEREKISANLLRSVSHDLRTPLTAISGSISTVLENEGLKEDEKRELLTNAKENAEWLCTIIENLLSITKISGKSTLSKTEELIEEVLSEAAEKFKKNNPDVSVSITCPQDPIFIPMDSTLIEQVLLNLMDNSVKHGKTTSHIYINAIDNDESFIEIHVLDDGTGIDNNIISSLFDGTLLLNASDNEEKSKFMGIGLSVCRTIVEAHNGTIKALNNNDFGAEFIFTLPKGENINDN